MPSQGYTSSPRVSNSPGGYYEVFQKDWGVLGGAAPALAYNAGVGSLAMSTARCAITWITAQGESLVSTEATVSIAAASGAFTITQPTVPTNGGTVIGWRVYSSSGGAGSALLNVAANSTTQVQQNFTTTQGVIAGFAVATTAVQVLIYGAGQAEPTLDQSGIQVALPSIPASTTVDYFVVVPNNGRVWSVQDQVSYMRPQGVVETAAITIGNVDIVAPLWQAGTSYGFAAAAGAYIVVNSVGYVATVTGTTSGTIPAAFSAQASSVKGTLIVDNTQTWKSLGPAIFIRMHINNSAVSAAIPAAQEYDFIAT
jgi:hypothetical protein